MTTVGSTSASFATRRQPGVPDRERIAGMEAAVAELVDDAERGQVERLELPHSAEVERARRRRSCSTSTTPRRRTGPPRPSPRRLSGVRSSPTERALGVTPGRVTRLRRPARSQSVVSIVPSRAKVSASAPASAARLHANDAAIATPNVCGRPSARTKMAPGTMSTHADAAVSRRMRPSPCAGRRASENERQGRGEDERDEER